MSRPDHIQRIIDACHDTVTDIDNGVYGPVDDQSGSGSPAVRDDETE